MGKTLLDDALEVNADGIDFVSCNSHLENGVFVGQIYESYTIEEFKQCTGYPRSGRLFWKGTKDNKEYIDIKNIETFDFGTALKYLKEGKTVTAYCVDSCHIKLQDCTTIINGYQKTSKMLTIRELARDEKLGEIWRVWQPTADILFSDGWRIVENKEDNR